MVDDRIQPVKWCPVKLHEVIDRGKRLEASVFDIEAKRVREMIANGKYRLLSLGGPNGVVTAHTEARFKRIWLKTSPYPIYQPSSIVEVRPEPDGYISHLTKTDLSALKVSAGQILMTCSGTIGKVALVTRTLDQKIFSHDLLRIDCKDKGDIGYVYTYLKSKTGNKILLTNEYGAVITHIEPEHLATVPIPDAPADVKKEINELIFRSYALRDESNDLIDEADRLLRESLSLPSPEAFEEGGGSALTFSIKLSRLNCRADASYHIPLVRALIRHLQAHAAALIPVGDGRISADVILPGRFKRVYVEEGFGRVLFGGKQIGELDPSGKKYLSMAKHAKRYAEELAVHEDMTLITRSGTIGKTALVPKHWENWAASEHIIRVIPASKEIAGYLNIFLSSRCGRALITHYTYGSVVDEIDDNQVREIPVPILKDPSVQKRINDLALEAKDKRYEAYCLERQAASILDEKVIYG